MYYFRLSPSKRLKYGANRILLSSSFLISHYHLLFSGLHTPLRHIHPVQWAQVKDSHTPIHQSISSSPCSIRFWTFFFHHTFWREYIKKEAHAPTCIRFCSSLPCHFWTTISLIIQPESFLPPPLPPLTSIYEQSFAQCLLFSCFGLPQFHALPCLVFIHLHPDTNRHCLHPSYGIGLSF